AGRSTKGTGTGTGSADGSGDSDTTNYGGLVLQHIQRNRRSNAAGAGRVRLKITIAPNGRVRNVAIAKTSGSTRFDRQAMRMVKMASPYPKPPPGQRPILVWITGS
ncbi:MAG: energy transducer TonB, partial [Pseudomonadota bacterium]